MDEYKEASLPATTAGAVELRDGAKAPAGRQLPRAARLDHGPPLEGPQAFLAGRTASADFGAGPYLRTWSGRAFPLLRPQAVDIHPRDLVEHLAKINRFTGALRRPYSVAEHSLLVADILIDAGHADAEPYGALHDGHEAYTGDISSPMQAALRLMGAGDALRRITDPIDRAVHEHLGLPWPPPPAIVAAVRHADLLALATEARDLFMDADEMWAPNGLVLPDPLPRRLPRAPMDWEDAADRLHARFRRLGLVR